MCKFCLALNNRELIKYTTTYGLYGNIRRYKSVYKLIYMH